MNDQSIIPVPLMAHLVAGYPDMEASLAAAEGLVEGGAAYLEIQIPFSDPSADGPTIRDACAAALAQGFSVYDSFLLIKELRRLYPSVPLFVMAYASLVVTPGVGPFVDTLATEGVRGLIVPDLPFDTDEGLAAACASLGPLGPAVVPVAAPSMHRERLLAMAHLGRPYVYAALRTGITGAVTDVDQRGADFLDLCAHGGSQVLGGFGIRTGAQARLVAPHVHAVVAGSVFVEAIRSAVSAHGTSRRGTYPGSLRVRNQAIRQAVRAVAEEITGRTGRT
jgi:tryptophan synthase alpha chain